MKVSMKKKIGLVLVLFILLVTGIWGFSAGRTSYGAGLIGSALAVGIVSWRNIKKIADMENKGIDVYDERVIQIAGLAARGAMTFCVLGLCIFIMIGAVFGPVIKVNPYDFAGYLMAIIVLLYAGFYTYHSRRL